MTEANHFEQSPQDSIDIKYFDSQAIIALDKPGSWYERTFTDRDDLTVDHVLTTLRNFAKPLAEYADRYKAFFVVDIQKPNGRPAEWTVMPGYDDKQISKQISPKYAEKLQDSWGHVIIGPSGDAFRNSEQIGVMDADLQDGTYAFDVTNADGIACDHISRVRNKVVAEPGKWVDWHGSSAVDGYDYEVDPLTEKTEVVSVGRIALW